MRARRRPAGRRRRLTPHGHTAGPGVTAMARPLTARCASAPPAPLPPLVPPWPFCTAGTTPPLAPAISLFPVASRRRRTAEAAAARGSARRAAAAAAEPPGSGGGVARRPLPPPPPPLPGCAAARLARALGAGLARAPLAMFPI